MESECTFSKTKKPPTEQASDITALESHTDLETPGEFPWHVVVTLWPNNPKGFARCRRPLPPAQVSWLIGEEAKWLSG